MPSDGVHKQKTLGLLSGFVQGLFLLEGIDQIDGMGSPSTITLSLGESPDLITCKPIRDRPNASRTTASPTIEAFLTGGPEADATMAGNVHSVAAAGGEDLYAPIFNGD